MTLPSHADLEVLLSEATPPCVSIYLPTHRRDPGIDQDPIRLRGLLGDAAASLDEVGLRRSERDALLEPATELLDDPHFWQHQDQGLAIFLATERSRRFPLPIVVPELVVVGERFHIHPLVELFTEERHVLVLTLSQHQVRLFDATRWSVNELSVPTVPQGVDATMPEQDRQESLQLRRSSAGPGDAAFFHGHGGAKDAANDRRERYVHAVERALRPVLARRDDPLVIAGAAPLAAEFRAHTSYPHVVGELAGAPDRMDPSELRDAAWQLVEPQTIAARRAALSRYAQAAGTGRTSTDPVAIAHAAMEGRVELLLVSPATEDSGHDPAALSYIDDAILHTLRHGGDIQTIPAPETEHRALPAALLRY